ncbi:hypothetical protein ROS1_27590 [Roseibium sp. ROS1]
MNMQTNSTLQLNSLALGSSAQLIEHLQKVGLCATWAEVDDMIERLIELTDIRDGDCDLEDTHDAERDNYLL